MDKRLMASACVAIMAAGVPAAVALTPNAVRAQEKTAEQTDGKKAESGAEAPEDAWRFTIGAGGIYHPDYTGSDEYEPAAFPVVKIERGPLYLETDGPGVRANIMPHGLFEFGPIVRFGEGRSDVEDDVVDRLPEIDDALWLGLFAGYTEKRIFGDRDSLGVELEALKAATDDNGTTITIGVKYGVQATRRLSLSIGTSATYADTDYADTYFSVDADGAAASGLSQYAAGSGLRDVGIRLSARYAITRQIGLGGFAGVSRLVGDFADSPIVDERGSATQGIGGLFLTYTF